MIFNTAFGVKMCDAFAVWRSDDPSILPTCSICTRQIKCGEKYGCAISGNAVLCSGCSEAYKRVK